MALCDGGTPPLFLLPPGESTPSGLPSTGDSYSGRGSVAATLTIFQRPEFVGVNVSNQLSDLIPLLLVGKGLCEDVSAHVVSGTRVDDNMLVLLRLMEKRRSTLWVRPT